MDLKLDIPSQNTEISTVPYIVEADERSFEKEALVESMACPVIVDFWSQNSPACKQMMSVLEKLVKEAKGKLRLVKVNVAKAPSLVQMLQIQSVPTVFAFFQGKPIDGFSGVKSEPELKSFIQKIKLLADPNPDTEAELRAEDIKRVMGEADAHFKKNDFTEAMASYSTVLDIDSSNMEALAGIAWCFVSQGDVETVEEMLGEVTPEQLVSPNLKSIQFIVSLKGTEEELKELEAQFEKSPKDITIGFDLAKAYIGEGSIEKGIDQLVSLIRIDREWEEEKVRKFLLELFDVLSPKNSITSSGRRKLSSVLFS